jgi:serine O-acetyltransferase
MALQLLAVALRSSGFHLMVSYRMAHALVCGAGPLGRVLAGVLFWWNRHFYTCSIAPTARLHGGVILPHPQGIVIGAGVVVGPRAWIFQNVTIGGAPGKIGAPAIGADARIYIGAVVAGPIKVGDNVVIGANAFVQRDVPEQTVVRCPRADFAPLPERFEVE